MHSSSKSPVISVVIPVYNRANKIRKAIESVLVQTYQNWEVIVIDDGSTDQTREIIKEMSRADGRIKLIELEGNFGAQRARNEGIKAARGEWVTFLDSDDEYLPDSIKDRMDIALRDNVQVVHSECYIIKPGCAKELYKIRPLSGRIYTEVLEKEGPVFPSLLVKRTALEQIGLLDENIKSYQEWDTSIRLAKEHAFAFCPQPTFIYDYRCKDSMSRNSVLNGQGYRQVFRKHCLAVWKHLGMKGIAYHLERIAKWYKDGGKAFRAGWYFLFANICKCMSPKMIRSKCDILARKKTIMFSALSEYLTVVIARRAEARRSNPKLEIASRPSVARNDKSVSSGLNKYKKTIVMNKIKIIKSNLERLGNKEMLGKMRQNIKSWLLNNIYEFLMSPAKHFTGRRLFGAEELKLLHQALISQSLFGVDGKMVGRFEQEFARAYGVPYAVASTSGTAAIHTAVNAISIEPGDEVITAPITDLGTIIPILNEGGIPVFADIDETYNMDPADVERKITDRTKAIIVVHLFGNPCDMDAMMAVARKHNIKVIEDCSQAHMTEYKGRMVGTIGDIGCFSFQQSKHMTTGDGGMTITNNPKYYEHMKLFVDKGFARKGWGPRAYMFHGQNYRMNELTAAVGIAQLKKVASVIKKRHELGSYMSELLKNVPGIRTCPVTEGAGHSYWLYPLYIEGANIERIGKILKREWVPGSIGYTVKPIYLCADSLTKHKTYGSSQYPFSWKDVEKQYEYKEGLCPKAEHALNHLYTINMHECWTRERIEKIVEVIKEALAEMKIEKTATESVKPPAEEKASVNVKTSDKEIRIGIIGCGLMGNMHLTALKSIPDVKVSAYTDTDIDKARTMAKRLSGNVYASHKDMLADENLDAVTICTVPSTHREIVIDALNAGAHVLCEKPLAISVQEAEEMTRVAEQKGKVLLTAFKFRFFEEVREAKKLIDQGSLGNIVHFRVMFGGFLDMNGSWYVNKNISGGGIVMDNGPHALDLIQYLLGGIRQITPQFTEVQKLGVEDTALLGVQLENDAKGAVELSWSIPTPSSYYMEIYGDNGTILLDLKGISYKFKTWSEFKRVDNKLNATQAFALQFAHFIESLSKKPTVTLPHDGLRTQKVIDAIYQNAKKAEQRASP